jgi:hypothetical protein
MKLIPKREKPLMVAVTTIQGDGSGPNPHAPRVARGMTLPHDHYLVKAHPEAFEPAPTGVVRGSSPGPNEPAAIARTTFIASDGKWLWGGTRLHPWDGLVRAAPHFFHTELPRD